ncbi:MAG: trypsin-like peptidase domain-containing protein [Anaerolineales bacterium]
MKTNLRFQSKLFVSLIVGLTLVLMTSCSALPAVGGVNSLVSNSSLSETTQRLAAPAPLATNVPASEGILAMEGTLEQIYQQVNPSVVNIRVVQKVSATDLSNSQIPFFSLPQDQGQSPDQYQSGLGSGFVWDTQGHIITNNHVIKGADKIEVTLTDGTILPAELVGADPDSDLAVLKVDLPSDIAPLQLANADTLKVGQLAIAIGNPFGLEGTMTVGIVSALGRSLPTGEGLGPSYTIPDIIQTDAPINPGNSGGVLVNEQGQVIGVTAAIESQVGQNAGIGFAIPSSIVQQVVPTLISDGHFDHAWLGISGTSLVPELSTPMNLDSNQRGVLVIDVMPNSPAEKAGLIGSTRQIEIEGNQVRVGGDVIIAIDGQTMQQMDDLIAYLAENTQVGQNVDLTVLRNGKEETVTVTLAARPSTQENTQAQSETTTQGAHLGIYGLDMNQSMAQAMNLPNDTQGVLVEQVQAGGPADQAGIQGSYKPFTVNGQEIYVGGDVITAIDGQSLSSIQQLQSILSQMEPGQQASLSILRNGKSIDVKVDLGQ